MRQSQRMLTFALLVFSIGVSCRLFSDVTPQPVSPNTTDLTLQFIPDTLPDAQLGATYEVEVKIENVKTFVGEFNILEGPLPMGLTLERVSSENAVRITGIPTEKGEFKFTLQAICVGTNDPGQMGDHVYQIVVK